MNPVPSPEERSAASGVKRASGNFLECLGSHPQWLEHPLKREVEDLLLRIRTAPSIMTVLEEEAAKSPRHKILLAALHLHGAAITSTPETALSLLLDAERSEAEVPKVLLHAAVELSPLTVQTLWATRALEGAPWNEITREGETRFQRSVPFSLLGSQDIFGNPGFRVEQLVSHALQHRSDKRERLPSDQRPKSVVSVSFSFEDLGNGQGVFHFTSPEANDALCAKLPEIVLDFSRFLAEGWGNGPEGTLCRTFCPFSPLCLTVFHALSWAAARSEENRLKITLFEKGREVRLQDIGWGGMSKALDGTPPSELSDSEMYQAIAYFIECGFDTIKSIPTTIQTAVLAFADQHQLTAELTAPQSLVTRLGACQEF